MIFRLENSEYIDTSIFYDASIGLSNTKENPRAWYVDFPIIEPVREGGFVGSVEEGYSVNFRNISFNPHGHGTHIECLGHVTRKVFSVNQLFKDYFLKAQLITIQPETFYNEEFQVQDTIIRANQIAKLLHQETECLMIRTLPNPVEKRHRNYSNTNFTYLEQECVKILDQFKVKHFIIDLPSVDREVDNGKLSFHKSFWKVDSSTPDYGRTITEFAYFEDSVQDGEYLLNMQTAPIDNDATLCRPLLFPIFKD